MSKALKNKVKLNNVVDVVADYGADPTGVADSTTAIQAAITAAAGKPILVPSGTYKITSGLTYTTSGESSGITIRGDGVGKTVFDNQVANGALLTLDGSGTPNTYGMAAVLDGFTITTTTSPVVSRGIVLKGQWFASLNRIKIKSLSSDGVEIINNNSDADGSSFVDFNKCNIASNGGWGVNCANPSISSNASGNQRYNQCYIVGNTSGGVRSLGISIDFSLCSIASNGGPGIQLPYVAGAGTPTGVEIRECEFDANTTYHIDVQAAIGLDIHHCKFVYAGSYTGIRIGDGGAGTVRDVKCRINTHRIDSGTVTVHAIGANASSTDVMDNYYPALTGVTKITDSGSFTRVRDSGSDFKGALSTNTNTGSGSYTPNVSTSKYHRIVVNATGAFTVNAPTGGVDNGQELLLDIFNASGGAITVTFATGSAGTFYSNGGYTDPANGKRKSARFIYHSTDGRWVQIGSWSPDM